MHACRSTLEDPTGTANPVELATKRALVDEYCPSDEDMARALDALFDAALPKDLAFN